MPIELKVEYKKLNTFFADYTKNISKGGTFIKTPKPLPLGTEFLFKLTIPAMPEPLTLRGRVVWLNKEGEISHPEVHDLGMGIRFVFADDSARAEFEQTVGDLMRESLGDHLYRKLILDGLRPPACRSR